MKNLIAKIADQLAPALVAFPVAIMLTTAAHAQPVKVRIGDLNLASHTGQAAFAQRVDAAARSLCGSEKNLGIQAACKTGVRQEAQEKLAMSAPSQPTAIAAR